MRMCVISFVLMLSLLVFANVDGNQATVTKGLDKCHDCLMSTLINLIYQEKREREDIIKQFDGMKKSVKGLKRSVSSLAKNTSKSQTNLQDQINDIKRQINSASPKYQIGFTARLNNSGVKNGVIIFHHITTNNGNGFSMKTGRFTCKIPGMYVFILTITSTAKDAVAFIKKNGGKFGYVVTSYSNGWNAGSTSVALMLTKGDFVTAESGGKFPFGSYTTFSGFLISG